MGKMKELLMIHVDRISWENFDNEFYNLTAEQQNEVWALAEQAAQDYLASLIDTAKERRKYEH